MSTINQIMVEVLSVAQRAVEVQARALGTEPNNTPASTAATATETTPTQQQQTSTNASQSPLLFFVALGFGVVFTNLW
jgi:hypothetical protein